MTFGVITAVDRFAGTITVSSQRMGLDSFLDAKKAEIDALYQAWADQFANYLYDNGPSLGLVNVRATALECGVAAAVVLGGLGWIIARRNALAGTEEVSESWMKALVEWLTALVRGLFETKAPQLPAHAEDT